ncbi:MAG: diversity-generating retroelement protein Avd [Thermodesulfobacteriota bacterium]
MKNTTPQAVQACHELLQWMIPQLDKFPRVRRYTLGERLETGLLEVLEDLVAAAYSRSGAKQEALARANLRLETVRHLWRLAHELKAASPRSYEHGARLFDDLGRQVGGWLRSTGKPARQGATDDEKTR